MRIQRKNLGYTQKFLSEFSGFSVSFISDIENGKSTAEIGKVMELASLLFLDKRGENVIIPPNGAEFTDTLTWIKHFQEGIEERMATQNRKLPIGMQDFEDIRKNGYLYVDKTEYIYKLVNNGKPYFLSRPRRFGKSLFLSTLRAYFEGKKELFAGLKIEELENESPNPWQNYPVFYFDFNKKNFREKTAFEEVLKAHLTDWEQIYGDEFKDKPLEERFQRLIEKAYNTSGKG